MLVNSLLTITVLFGFYLLLKSGLKLKLCALCAAISTVWIVLLSLDKIGFFQDRVLLSLLIGQSITGVFYLVQNKVGRELRIFTLPFFLTLTAIFYLLITGFTGSLMAFAFLFVLWIISYLIFINRNDPGKRPVVEEVINCCSDK